MITFLIFTTHQKIESLYREIYGAPLFGSTQSYASIITNKITLCFWLNVMKLVAVATNEIPV